MNGFQLVPFQSQYCLLAFDECHCISEWGLDFRPKYREAGSLASVIEAPVLCLTATVTPVIKADVERVLKLKEPTVVAVLPDRPEVYLEVIRPKTNDKFVELQWLVDRVKAKQTDCEKILIFFTTIRETAIMYGWLEGELEQQMYVDGSYETQDRLVEMYHAGMDPEVKDRVMSGFMQSGGKMRVLCATVAFGLGVSVDDIDIVVLWGVPKTCLALWQEVGRVARDQRRGQAVIYRTGYTLGKCDKSVTEALTAPCIRNSILSNFIIEDQELPSPTACDGEDCDSPPCTCPLCSCCSSCRQSCKCEHQRDPLEGILLR